MFFTMGGIVGGSLSAMPPGDQESWIGVRPEPTATVDVGGKVGVRHQFVGQANRGASLRCGPTKWCLTPACNNPLLHLVLICRSKSADTFPDNLVHLAVDVRAVCSTHLTRREAVVPL